MTIRELPAFEPFRAGMLPFSREYRDRLNNVAELAADWGGHREAVLAAVTAPPAPPPRTYWLARITASLEDVGYYAATQVHWDGAAGAWADVPGGYVWDEGEPLGAVYAINGDVGVTDGTIVQVFRVSTTTAGSLFWFQPASGGTEVMFRVTLEQDGGSEGSKTLQCSFTYTARTVSGDVLGVLMTPEQQRPVVGPMVSGDGRNGFGYLTGEKGSIEFRLFCANEVIKAAAC